MNWGPHPYQAISDVFYNNFRLFLAIFAPSTIVSETFKRCSLRCLHACLWWNCGQPAIHHNEEPHNFFENQLSCQENGIKMRRRDQKHSFLPEKPAIKEKLAVDLAAHRHLIDMITVAQNERKRFNSVPYPSPIMEVCCCHESLLVRTPYSRAG